MNFTIFGLTLNLTQYIIVFFVCQFINVALNTAKTIVMHKEEKISSSIINAITYGFYCIIVVMTASALPLLITIAITIITNLIGVYFSMIILEKFKKDKLWEIVATITMPVVANINLVDRKAKFLSNLENKLKENKIPYTYTPFGSDKFMFNFYCNTQKDTTALKEILKDYDYKYIIHQETVKL